MKNGSLGVAAGFVKVKLGHQTFYAALVHMCDKLSEVAWRKQSVELAVVNSDDIVEALYYVEEANHIEPLFSLH